MTWRQNRINNFPKRTVSHCAALEKLFCTHAHTHTVDSCSSLSFETQGCRVWTDRATGPWLNQCLHQCSSNCLLLPTICSFILQCILEDTNEEVHRENYTGRGRGTHVLSEVPTLQTLKRSVSQSSPASSTLSLKLYNGILQYLASAFIGKALREHRWLNKNVNMM